VKIECRNVEEETTCFLLRPREIRTKIEQMVVEHVDFQNFHRLPCLCNMFSVEHFGKVALAYFINNLKLNE